MIHLIRLKYFIKKSDQLTYLRLSTARKKLSSVILSDDKSLKLDNEHMKDVIEKLASFHLTTSFSTSYSSDKENETNATVKYKKWPPEKSLPAIKRGDRNTQQSTQLCLTDTTWLFLTYTVLLGHINRSSPLRLPFYFYFLGEMSKEDKKKLNTTAVVERFV
ncbi:unnamed protein product [Didymodactylos carnosus]|uniref:Uncharacterized protein n=1 Tax=Didymodactylos carnosus TaxID=1234261 RepID=A0A813SIW4_9BILA|nr:unnamed protein product [Didymodactylos carnosus]CAF3582452.1 unnamed protein product [Didymodactylos carnosus]